MTNTRLNFIAACCILAFMVIPVAACLAQPGQPGPNFFWLEQHTNPLNITVPSHWEYIGKHQKNKEWIPDHENKNGEWIKGQWQMRKAKKKEGKKWIPGHYGPEGKWAPERWEE